MIQLLAPGMVVRSKAGDPVGRVQSLSSCCIEVATASGVRFVPRRDIFTVEHDELLASSAKLSDSPCGDH